MQIFSTNLYKPTFKQIDLSENEKMSSSELISALKISRNEQESLAIKSKIFDIFTPHLKKEIEEKGNKPWILKNDFAQELYYCFFDNLEKIKNNELSFSNFLEILNSFKPSYNERNPITDKFPWSIKHYSTEKPMSDPESRELLLDLSYTIQDFGIDEKIVELRGSGKTYKEIADILNVSETTVRRRILKHIGKIQKKNDILPEEYKIRAICLKTNFNIEEDIDYIQNKLIQNGFLVNYTDEELILKTKTLAKLLKVSEKEMASTMVTYPTVWTLSPSTIDDNLAKASELLTISKETLVKAFMVFPNFINISPENINKKVETISQNLNIDKEDYVKAALKNPPLFYHNPEMIERFIENGCNTFGVSREVFIKTALKNPRLFVADYKKLQSNLKEFAKYIGLDYSKVVKIAFAKPAILFIHPDRIKNNIETLSGLLNVSQDKLIKAGIKSPNIFYQSPETLNNNVETAAYNFGVEKDVFLKSVLKVPTIISQSPETLNKKINDSSISLEIEKKDFIKMALAHPNLFYQNVETLNENVNKLANLLGCSRTQIIECSKKAPQILSMKPETIYKNIAENARLTGVTKEKVLLAALKNPQLFYFNPQTVYEKEKIKEFYAQIKGKDYEIFSTKLQTSTIDAHYMQVLCYLIKKEFDLTKVEPQNINKILEDVKDRIIYIPKHEISENVIEFAQKVLPKNKIKILVKK